MGKLLLDGNPFDADELEREAIPGNYQCVASLSGLVPSLWKINLESLVGEGELSPYRRVWGASGKEEDGKNS